MINSLLLEHQNGEFLERTAVRIAQGLSGFDLIAGANWMVFLMPYSLGSLQKKCFDIPPFL